MRLKRLISAFIACAMLMTFMPMQAFAADDADTAKTWTKELSVDELYHAIQDQLDENNAIALADLTAIEAIANDVHNDVAGRLTAIMFDNRQIVLAELDDTTSYTLTFAEEANVDAAPAEPAAEQPAVEPGAGESVTVPSEPAANSASTETQQTTGPPAEPEAQQDVSLTVTEKEVFTTESEAKEEAQAQGADPAAVSIETGEDGQVLGATLTVNETKVSKVTLTYAAEAAEEPEEDPLADLTVVEDTEAYTVFTPSMLEEMGVSLNNVLTGQEMAELLGQQGRAAIELDGTAYAFEADSALTLTVDWENDQFTYEGQDAALLVDLGIAVLGLYDGDAYKYNDYVPENAIPAGNSGDTDVIVDVDKTATPSTTQGQWDITLTADIKQELTPQKQEVVLLIDTSGSMAWCTHGTHDHSYNLGGFWCGYRGETKDNDSRLAKTKEVAKKLIQTLADRGLNVSVAVTSFASAGDTNQSLVSLSASGAIAKLEKAINDLEAGGSTQMRSGLKTAGQAFSNDPAKKTIIMLADGDDDSYLSTSEVAENLRRANVAIYTVGFMADNDTLQDIAGSDDHYFTANNASALGNAFDTIANQLTAMINDPLGDDVSLVGEVQVEATGLDENDYEANYDADNNLITWNPTDSNTAIREDATIILTYTVKVNDPKVGVNNVALNGDATFNYFYTKDGKPVAGSADYPTPQGTYSAGRLNQEFQTEDGTEISESTTGEIQYLSWGVKDQEPQTGVTQFSWNKPEGEITDKGKTYYYQYSYQKGKSEEHFDGTSQTLIPAVAEDVTIVHVYGTEEPKKQGTPITVNVYVDNQQVNASDYITVTGLSGTTDLESKPENDSIKIDYTYEEYDCADFKIEPVTDKTNGLVLQAINATLIGGSNGSGGIKKETGYYTLDNVNGGSTVSVYLYTPYTVEYYQDGTLSASVTDTNSYVAGGQMAAGSVPTESGNVPSNYTWVDNTYPTTVNLKSVPNEYNGWYTSADGTTSHAASYFGSEIKTAAENNEDSTPTVIECYARKQRPHLNVQKTVVSVGGTNVADQAAIPEAKVGDTIVYQIVVTNDGNVKLEGIAVTDILKAGDETRQVTWASGSVTSNITLAAGEHKTLTASYVVQSSDAGKTLTNTATATSSSATDSDEVAVDVTAQHKLTVNYYYDSVAENNKFTPDGVTTEYMLNQGDAWNVVIGNESTGTHNAPQSVTRTVDSAEVNYTFDPAASISILSGTVGDADVVVNLIYAEDEIGEENPDTPDQIPDKYQVTILYVAAKNGDVEAGTVAPAKEVKTIYDGDSYAASGSVTATGATATAKDDYFFNKWTKQVNSTGETDTGLESVTNQIDLGTVHGGDVITFTAYFTEKTYDVDVTKMVDQTGLVSVGDTLNYTITVKNTGNVELKGITVTDTLWENGKVTKVTVDGTEKTVSATGYTIESLAADTTVTITYSYTVQESDVDEVTQSGTITNKVTASTGDDPLDEDTTTTTVIGRIQVAPADITIYTGGDGYTGAVAGSETLTDSGLPEPGFYVTLPEALDDALKNAVGHEGDGPLDLSDYVTITATATDNNPRSWTLERYDEKGASTVTTIDGKTRYIYRIVPAEGQKPVRVQFTDDQGKVILNDEFDIALDTLYQEYDMSIYPGPVDENTVKIIVNANKETDNVQAECAVDSQTGKLTVRGIVDAITTEIVNKVPEKAANITAIADAGTKYYINGSELEVADGHEVKLLVDEIVGDAQSALKKAIIVSSDNDIDEDFEFRFKYLDLVDTSNGNVWITPSQKMTVFWPYPNGTDKGTEFQVIHFVGLDRNYDNLETELQENLPEYLNVTHVAGGITFTVDSFSPFALVWEPDDDNGGGGAHHPEYDPDDDRDDDDDDEEIIDEEVPLAETPWLNTKDHYAYIIGYAEDGTVRPNANITRAEVATIFFRLLTDEARDLFWSTSNNFSDVTADAWYNNAVSTMVNAGIIQGYEDGTFRPNNNITRAEFAAIASRFMSSGYDVEEDLFIDIANHWARENINDAAMAGWINGYPGGIFLPDQAITRAEAVTLVNNVLQRKPHADHMLDTMIKWPDNPEGAWYYEAIQEATNSHDYDLFEDAEYEIWTALQPNRDWAALEKGWLNAHSA